MNRNFIFASLLAAISLNVAIIGCHRKGDNESGKPANGLQAAADSTAAAATVDSLSAADSTANPYENVALEIKTFKNESAPGGFGYDIYMDSILYVHQPHIPAVEGTMGFTSEEKARRAGEFVAYKIRHNIMPPSVTPKELDSLGVLKKAASGSKHRQ